MNRREGGRGSIVQSAAAVWIDLTFAKILASSVSVFCNPSALSDDRFAETLLQIICLWSTNLHLVKCCSFTDDRIIFIAAMNLLATHDDDAAKFL